MKSQVIITGVVALATAALIYNIVSTDRSELVNDDKTQLINTTQEENSPVQYEAEVLAPAGLSKLVYESQNINTGVIGINPETNIDDPHDNTFHVYLDGEVENGRQAWLEYDLYGAEDYTSVSRAINDEVAIGGAFIKLSQEWSAQSEKIDASRLHKGDNIIRFSIPGNNDFNYIVKNVRIRFDESVDMSRRIVLNQPLSKSYYNRYGYISGFVSGKGSENAKIYANGKQIRSNQAAFEGLVDQIVSNSTDWKAVITAVFADGQVISDTARFCNPATCDFTNELETDIAYNESMVNSQLPVHLNLPGFELNGEPGSVTNKVKMSVTALRSQDMALPRLSMVNVTGGSDGFRCLPHGNLFAKEVEVRIKYDTARIPKGYGPKDIRTFYYSEEQNDWIMLPYDTFDLATNEIVSHTNHFTDFINAILKTPESPQTQAFTPTSMKDMKYADPIAHINMMSPPQANNSGTANLSYPIQIPAGRQGLQPQLAISYSSEGGNSWLGVGWSMNIPSISVETRWGVPVYSSSQETEEYLVNGQQVVELDITTNDTTRLPLVHQASYRSRNTDSVMYSYRVEGAFDRIIRRGSSPSTYWWEVIDKQGTHYYYGKYSTDASVNTNCVLKDASGNIAHWALAEMRDQYGNYVKYNYDVITYTGTPGNGGKQIYPSSIVYTGFGTTDGPYSVSFQYSSGRSDYMISGNYGFLQVTDNLLTNIYVKYNNSTIRRYYILYESGAYDKKLMCGIADISDSARSLIDLSCSNIAEFTQNGIKTHKFEYYKETGVSFSSQTSTLLTQLETQENVSGVNYTDSVKQSIGKSVGVNGSVGGSLCFGIKPSMSKNNTIGVNVSVSGSVMKDKVSFMDINGDGITDKVFKDGNDYKYFKGMLNSSNEVYFPASATVVSGLPLLGRNYSYSGSLGGEIDVKLLPVQGTGSISGSVSKQMTDAYFTDVNADGYVDFIKSCNVYFNKPDANGNPVFYAEDCNSSIQYFAEDSCYYTIHDGQVDSSFIETDDSTNLFFRRDPVRIWVAPKDGKGIVYSSIKRDNSSASGNFSDVMYTIQKNGTILYCGNIDADDTTTHNVTLHNITLYGGDRLYFRMHATDNSAIDDVNWQTMIYSDSASYYSHPAYHDADNKPLYKFNYSDDWTLTDKQYFIAPLDGTIKISGSLVSPKQSDSLRFVIRHNQSALYDTSFIITTSFSKAFNYSNVQVDEGDSVFFDLFSATNVDWSSIDFNGRIQYLAADSITIDTTNQFQKIEFYPPLDMTIFSKRVIVSAPIVQSAGSHSYYPVLTYSAGSSPSGTFVYSVKTKNKLLGRKTLTVVNGVIQQTLANRYIPFTLASSDTVYFDVYTMNQSLGNCITNFYVTNLNRIPPQYSGGVHTVFPDSLRKFGNMYRSWGQFSYFDDTVTVECLLPVDESSLYYDFASADSASLAQFPFNSIDTTMSYDDVASIFDSYNIPDANSIKFASMIADCKEQRWVDFCPSAYCKPVLTGSSAGIAAFENLFVDTSLFDASDFPFPDMDNPMPTTLCGDAKAINKKSYQVDESFSIGVGLGSISNATASANFSQTYGKSDFMDMNGDRYPDITDQKQIQYTNAQGGISTRILHLDRGRVTQGSGYGSGLSYGIRSIQFRPTSASTATRSKRPNTSGSFGIGQYISTSKVSYMLADINGDGLTDIINQDDNKVQLSTGYNFVNEETWSEDYLSKNNSTSTSMNIGSRFQRSNFSWSAGIGGSLNNSYGRYTLSDVNNDGLTDISYINGNSLCALINTGHSFTAYTINSSYSKQLSKTTSHNVSGNVSATLELPIVLFKIDISGYLDGGVNFSSENYRLSDINGDGWMDYVYIESDQIKVKYGIPKKVNLLKEVTTPVQSSYTIDYEMTYPDRDNPQSKWVYASLKVYDGFSGDGQDTSYYIYSYDDPKYHRMERESFGFETVTTKQFRNFTVQNCYRYSIEKYHNDDYMFKGLKYYEVNYDTLNRKYVETYYTWDPKEISTGTIVPEDSIQCFGPYYPAISQEDKYFYEGQSAYQIHTKKTYRHTRFGNVRQYINYGDTAYTNDDFRAEIAYSYNSARYLMSMVDTMNVYDNGSTLLQRRTGDYTPEGRITTIGAYDGSNYAYTDITYDSYGNIDTIRFPENVNSERLQYAYAYETTLHTYPESVTDYWGNASYSDYDFKLGLPTMVWDVSGNAIKYTYYLDGKIDTIVGPNELNNNIPFTIKCEYWDEAGGTANNRWARTRHYDPINTGNEFVTMNFSDGLGRSVQSKQKTTIFGVDSMVVSGKVYYDAFGRAYRTSLPVTQALGTDSVFFVFTPTVFATTTFDYLDRPLTQTAFDNTQVSYSYYFGQDAFNKMCFRTIVYDPNNNKTYKYTSARGLNTSITAPYNTITKFVYDPLGTLIQSTDPDSNSTYYNYDLLGRLTSRVHPDAGTTSYTYDLSGNVLTTQTANLANSSLYIQYNYSDCRLDSIVYPLNPEMNVYYEYGDIYSGNQAGRLIRQQDASGVQSFEYGAMGELVKNVHTFVVPGGNGYTLETDWEYDSWNRMMSITYPDGELVSYHYDNGGKLSSMDAVKGFDTFNYIDTVQYNKYGSRTRIDYGNGTRAEYTYDPLNQRLSNLTSYEVGGYLLQSINYNYDNVGNINYISNSSDYVGYGSDMGGNYSMEYSYDELYRLTGSAGSFESNNNGSLTNYLNMSYSASGNILTKEVYADVEIGGSVQTINYSNTYEYNDRPHTVTEAGLYKYEWDANGNLWHRADRNGGAERLLCWDEENRLTTVSDKIYEDVSPSSYIYNAGGDRTWKLTGEVYSMYVNGVGYVNAIDYEKTLYASPYLVVTDEGYTKHYFIEGERVVSKIGSSGWIGTTSPNGTQVEFIKDTTAVVADELLTMVKRGVDCAKFDSNYVFVPYQLQPFHIRYTAPETNLYFYHPDHLGSSSFITDATGYAVQHLQYLPFGETFVDQQNGYDSRYTFSAKEKDDETQYSYFGARYYDSDLSVWLSVDPLSDKYPSMSPYMYCAGNPVRLIDPDGNEIWITDEDGGSFMYFKGMQYDGDNEVVAQQVESLNSMYGTKNGAVVLDELCNSPNEYNVTNEKSAVGTAGFIGNENGGKLAMNGANDLASISHELFHAYQNDNGQGGRSIFNEVEAYVFCQGVVAENAVNNGSGYSLGSTPLSRNPGTENGNKYESAYNSVFYSTEFPSDDFNTAVSLFQSESYANENGNYDKYPLRRPNQKVSLLKNFYPIIK